MTAETLRRLPAMGRLLHHPRLSYACELYGRDVVRVQAQQQVAALRLQIREKKIAADAHGEWSEYLISQVLVELERQFGGLRRVINATGIFLHTNLGRAPLPAEVVADLAPILAGYCDLEIDPTSGKRGERNAQVVPALTSLCGAASALVTNNNAAALILAIATLARGREVVVSRGELVEIGGSFRIPEILEAAGARLREVGSTNRTRLTDYQAAIGPETALLLKVFPSNFRIRGFTEETSATELVQLGRSHQLPVMVDEGSGLLRRDSRPGLADHQSVRDLLAAGCTLVCCSGDKLLGGPQAGILLGEAAWVERCRRHPLYRALRPDRYTYAALGLVLKRHLASASMPLDRLWDLSALEDRLATYERQLLGHGLERREAEAFLGGGSAPDRGLPGPVLTLEDPAGKYQQFLRRGAEDGSWPPIFGRLAGGRLWLDLRTVDPADDSLLIRALSQRGGAP